jgi:hypothetical protein
MRTKMKLTRLFLGICCAAAALISCSKAEKVTKEAPTRPMTITLSTDEASTKISVDYNGTDTYTHKWQSGDAISVRTIIDGVGYNDKFELVSGAGTNTGVFSCATSHIPASGVARPTFFYPYTAEKSGTGWWKRSIENQGNGSLANLGKYDMLYAEAIYTDGVFDRYPSGGTPFLQVFFLKLPAGLQLVGNSSGSHSVDIELSGTGETEVVIEFLNNVNLNTATTNTGTIKLTGVALSDGKLVSDTYIAGHTNYGSDRTFSLSVKEGSSNVSYDLTRSGWLEDGTVYKLSQTQFTPVKNF